VAFQREERISTEFIAYRKNGTHFPLHFDMSPVLEQSGQVTHFVLMPPESLATGPSTSPRHADTDALTGLANRTFLHETLRRAIERSLKNPQVRFALLFIDLDGFKQVNDTLGHVIGDELLVTVARELEGAVRPGDVVARFGGDEFVVLIELLSGTEDAIAVAERIQDRLAVPLRLSGRTARVSGSIGVALSDTGYTAVEDVLRDADAAMYLAKEKGGGGYRIFDTHLQEAASTTQRIRAELQRSLERGDFRLHYQPVVDLASGRTTGFEALLRWQQAGRGIVPATEFIRQAEKTGLILPIGRWVIHEACRQARAWRDALPSDRRFTLSVNLSERELLDPSLLEAVRQAIADTGAEASWLRFEIPESLLARPQAESRAVLQPLIELGFRLGVGDFGRGQSSLTSLIRYPLDQLKIDRQFMVDLHERETSRRPEETRALRSILALAGELEIEVAAAGIETSSQRRVLQRLACRYGQGNLFSVPVDGSTAGALLRKT
jgi:diguanylate cyclase (GGDEF)-like protein